MPQVSILNCLSTQLTYEIARKKLECPEGRKVMEEVQQQTYTYTTT
jgi:hypothetical protein